MIEGYGQPYQILEKFPLQDLYAKRVKIISSNPTSASETSFEAKIRYREIISFYHLCQTNIENPEVNHFLTQIPSVTQLKTTIEDRRDEINAKLLIAQIERQDNDMQYLSRPELCVYLLNDWLALLCERADEKLCKKKFTSFIVHADFARGIEIIQDAILLAVATNKGIRCPIIDEQVKVLQEEFPELDIDTTTSRVELTLRGAQYAPLLQNTDDPFCLLDRIVNEITFEKNNEDSVPPVYRRIFTHHIPLWVLEGVKLGNYLYKIFYPYTDLRL